MVYRNGTYTKRRTMRIMGRVLIREEQCGVWEGYIYLERNNAVYGKGTYIKRRTMRSIGRGTYIKRRTMRCIGRVLILREEQCGV